MNPSKTSTDVTTVYSYKWAIRTLREWYAKHPLAEEIMTEVYPQIDDMMIVEWLRHASQQEHWEKYKLGVKYLEKHREKLIEYFKGDRSLYIRLVKRTMNPIFFDKFDLDWLDKDDIFFEN